MSEEVRTNKRRRSESEEPEDEGADGAGGDVVGAGPPGAEALDGARPHDNVTGVEAGNGSDQAAAGVAATATEAPKMPVMQNIQQTLPALPTHHQPRFEEKPQVDNYYKPEQQQTVDHAEYKIPGVNVMASMGAVGGMNNVGNVAGVAGVAGGMGVGGMTAGGMGVNASALGGLGGMGGLAGLGVPGMNLGGVGSVDLNQQILAAQQRQYEVNQLMKAQMQNNAVAAAAAAARSMPKPAAPTRKSAPSSYEPPVQLTASGRPARARRVNYAELAGAMDDEEEDDQSNLVPNWARRRRKNQDQDRDYGVGVGSSSRSAAAQMGGGGNQGMYGVANAGYNTAPRAAAPAAGVNLYGIAGNNAMAGQPGGWPGGQVVWGQAPGLAAGPYGALSQLAAARPQAAAAQQFLLQPGAVRNIAPGIMQDMQMMLSRAEGQGGMPGAGQQR